MTRQDGAIGRGDRLCVQREGERQARVIAEVADVVLGADGRPELVTATLRHPCGGRDLVVLSFQALADYPD